MCTCACCVDVRTSVRHAHDVCTCACHAHMRTCAHRAHDTFSKRAGVCHTCTTLWYIICCTTLLYGKFTTLSPHFYIPTFYQSPTIIIPPYPTTSTLSHLTLLPYGVSAHLSTQPILPYPKRAPFQRAPEPQCGSYYKEPHFLWLFLSFSISLLSQPHPPSHFQNM